MTGLKLAALLVERLKPPQDRGCFDPRAAWRTNRVLFRHNMAQAAPRTLFPGLEWEAVVNPLEAEIGQLAGAPGARSRLAHKQRERLLAAFADWLEEGGGGSVLQVGMRGRMPDRPLSFGPAARGPAIACVLDGGMAERGRYARADGGPLLYADGEFDWVYGENLLEHAGSFERQFELLKELNRVAKKGVFLSVANRRHPLDMESLLPLLHWLPTGLWRRLAGGAAGSRRLLSARELKHLVSLLPGQPRSDLGHIRLFGPKAVFFLMLRKA